MLPVPSSLVARITIFQNPDFHHYWQPEGFISIFSCPIFLPLSDYKMNKATHIFFETSFNAATRVGSYLPLKDARDSENLSVKPYSSLDCTSTNWASVKKFSTFTACLMPTAESHILSIGDANGTKLLSLAIISRS